MSNTATIPTPKEDGHKDNRWMSQHDRICGDCNLKKPAVLFIGDSIVQRMQDTESWEKYFQPLGAVNAGIGGDSIEHVMWRVENGLLEKCAPKVIVVLVGTNNHNHSADEVVEGLEALTWCINERSPDSKIVVLEKGTSQDVDVKNQGLLPRGEKNNELRLKFYQVNYNLERIIQTVPNSYFLNADPGFVRDGDTIAPEDMLDYLHLTRRGYSRLCPSVHSFVKKLLDGHHI